MKKERDALRQQLDDIDDAFEDTISEPNTNPGLRLKALSCFRSQKNGYLSKIKNLSVIDAINNHTLHLRDMHQFENFCKEYC